MRIVMPGTAGKMALGIIRDLSDHEGLRAAIRIPTTGQASSTGHDVGDPPHYLDNMETGREILSQVAGSNLWITLGRGHD